MPPKAAMDKTNVDDLLCLFLPKDLSKEAKLAIINDANFKSKNIAYEFNYNQLTDVASTLGITNDYGLMVFHANQCIEALKNIWKPQ